MKNKILKGLEKAAINALKRDDKETAKAMRLKMLRVIRTKPGSQNETE